MSQLDFFGAAPQGDLFGGAEPQPKSYLPDPADIRRQLLGVLQLARESDAMPWTREELRYHQTVFPQMSRWLPSDEAEQLCFAFTEEVKRLLAA
jgi:S-adenosylmethionine synthetase